MWYEGTLSTGEEDSSGNGLRWIESWCWCPVGSGGGGCESVGWRMSEGNRADRRLPQDRDFLLFAGLVGASTGSLSFSFSSTIRVSVLYVVLAGDLRSVSVRERFGDTGGCGREAVLLA